MNKLSLPQWLSPALPTLRTKQAESVLTQQESLLVERLRKAEPLAVDQLYRAHHQAVRTFAFRLVGDEAIAEDLLHEVFVQLPRLMRRFRGQSSLRSFLIGVAIRLGNRHIRAAGRRRAAFARLAHDAAPQACADPEAELVHVQRLHVLLDTLSLDQRAAFVLCAIEERSAEEASALLGVPEATVRTRCFHARKKLMLALQRRGEGAR